MTNREDAARDWFAELQSAIPEADVDGLKTLAKEAAQFTPDKLASFITEDDVHELIDEALELLAEEIDGAAAVNDDERVHRLKMIHDVLQPSGKDDEEEEDLVEALSVDR